MRERDGPGRLALVPVPVRCLTPGSRHSASSVGKADLKLEVVIIPVSDVDRSREFYERVGFRLDSDVAPMDGLRLVQTAPPGSGTSVNFGLEITTDAPGSAEAGLTVSDIEAARGELVSRRIEVSDIWHGPPFPVEARQPGIDPERTSYGSFFYFNDPDDNMWLVQEVTTRLLGRMNGAETGYVSTADLEGALRRAEAATASTSSTTGGRTCSTAQTRTTTGPPGTPPTWWPSRPGLTCRRDRCRACPGA